MDGFTCESTECYAQYWQTGAVYDPPVDLRTRDPNGDALASSQISITCTANPCDYRRIHGGQPSCSASQPGGGCTSTALGNMLMPYPTYRPENPAVEIKPVTLSSSDPGTTLFSTQ